MRRKNDEGAAALEFALCLFFLVPLVLGIIDFGIAMQVNVRVKNAANAGAAFAQSNPSAVKSLGSDNCQTVGSAIGNITDAVVKEQPGLNTQPAFTITVTDQSTAPATTLANCDMTTVPSGHLVRVKVVVNYKLPVSYIWGNTIALTGYRDVVVQ